MGQATADIQTFALLRTREMHGETVRCTYAGVSRKQNTKNSYKQEVIQYQFVSLRDEISCFDAIN